MTGLDLGGAVGAEHRQVCALAQAVSDGFGHLDTAADGNKVHVVAGTIQEDVPDISAHDVTFAAQFIGYVTHKSHDGQIDVFCDFLTVYIHFFVFRLQKYGFFCAFLVHVGKKH